ncbi:MAG TPA: sigma-70 family RNA polymerase sigma factor [Polyangiaceae bacterium]|nr:sigma-70 family RNA polymerase sigma factor [Polyangiaceae bacterium]
MNAHFDFVWRSLRRLGLSESEADAGARRVFVLASRTLKTTPPQREKRLLFAMVLRVASSHRRRRAKLRRAASRFEPTEQSEPEQANESGRARHALNEILAVMELEQCSVFMLYELEEMSTPEIAGLLDVSVETVCSRLHNAREEFDSALRRQRAGIGSGAKA